MAQKQKKISLKRKANSMIQQSAATHHGNAIPVLETERLRLRGHSANDLHACHALWTNEQVLRFIGRPSTEEECWTRLLRYRGHWALMGFGFWVVEDKLDGRFVGEVGYMNFHREITPTLGDTPEMGWALLPEAQGKGYASEAVAGVQRWGDVYFGSENALCLIHPENKASLRVAEKAGFSDPITTTYKDMPSVILRRGTVSLQ